MNTNLTQKIGVVPLRNIVVFPSNLVSLNISRLKSIYVLENAIKYRVPVFLCCQKNKYVEEPRKKDLFLYGTLAFVRKIAKNATEDTVEALVEGIRVAKINKHFSDYTTWDVNVGKVKQKITDTIRLEASLRILHKSVKEYYDILPNENIPAEILRYFNCNNARKSVYQIAYYIPISYKLKQEILEYTDLLEQTLQLISIINQEIYIYSLENKISKNVKVSIENRQRELYLQEKMKVIKELLNQENGLIPEYSDLYAKIKQSNLPDNINQKVDYEFNRLKNLSLASAESAVIRNYIEWIISLPWLEKSEGQVDLYAVKKKLDENHYGLDYIKERIIEYLAVQKLTNRLKTPILCLVGPPGVGKTSLAMSIAQAINRKFLRISFAGVHDQNEIRGHRRTYIGSMPGKIIQGLKRVGVNNPVFLLDEIDKMAPNLYGNTNSALLEILDSGQNTHFSDNYIEEPYDLSNIIFITTANDISKLSKPLHDRLEVIEIGSYTEEDKLNVFRKHILPKELAVHGLKNVTIEITEAAILEIIRKYTREAGVRGLERNFGRICRKIAMHCVLDGIQKIEIHSDDISKYLGKPLFSYYYNSSESLSEIGVATGLAYTHFGGDIFQVEVVLSKGKGKLVLTGKMGQVMKESVETAISYVRSVAEKFNIDEDFYIKYDIHVHALRGAILKDGPSAGITIAIALVSVLMNRPINNKVGMTGEITLHGRVLAVGGLKEKIISAHRAGLKILIVPRGNISDINDVPKAVLREVKIIYVDHMDEVLQQVLFG